MRITLLLLFLLLTPPVWAGGSLSGTVILKGGAKPAGRKVVTIDQQVCGRYQIVSDLLVGKGGEVRNAVVLLAGPVEGGKPLSSLGTEFMIDQKVCQFSPRIAIVPVGAGVRFLNSDPILHNVHTASHLNPATNRAQLAKSSPLELSFSRPEIFSYSCDLHAWMQGWLVIAEHPYYTLTDVAGKFLLTDIPAGRYVLKVWHERLGEMEKAVTLKEGEEGSVTFLYQPKGDL